MPAVSVIIPNYNHAPFLKERIDSVLQQTWQDMEVIILDDCSKDNSKMIIESYRPDVRVSHIIYNDLNSGNTFKQWQKGIEIAKGEYIWIAESDDWCEPSFLSTLMQAFQKDPALVLSYVQSYSVAGNNKVQWVSKSDLLEHTMAGKDFISKKLLHGNAIFNASMALFKKSTYLDIPAVYTNYKFCGDWLFWSEIARRGKVFISGKALNYFRNHDADVSGKAYADGSNYVEELQVLFSFLDASLISEQEFATALISKHTRYRSCDLPFSEAMTNKIEQLFYQDDRTKKYKTVLMKTYHGMVRKQKLKGLLRSVRLWN
jgi:glycosyltransferase involved in cell wall biosynthesis